MWWECRRWEQTCWETSWESWGRISGRAERRTNNPGCPQPGRCKKNGAMCMYKSIEASFLMYTCGGNIIFVWGCIGEMDWSNIGLPSSVAWRLYQGRGWQCTASQRPGTGGSTWWSPQSWAHRQAAVLHMGQISLQLECSVKWQT